MADDGKDIEGEEEGGGSKKKLIIIIAVVVLLLGGGAAAFFLMGGEEPVEGDEAVAEVVEEAPIEEGEPLYVELKPKFVVNLRSGGPASMLQIAIQAYTRNIEVSDFLEKNSPMIRNDVLNLLEDQDSAKLLTLEGKKALQASILDLLKKKLQELDQKGEIKGVYFTEFVLQ